MSGGDAAWLHMDRPVNELIVNAVLWFAEPVDEDTLRKAMDEQLVRRFAPFRQRVEDDGRTAWWLDDDGFDLDAHLFRHQLAAPGDLAELQRHATDLLTTALPRDRPLWQIHIVDGFDGGTALVARIHHCIGDGVALFRVLLSLSDEARFGGDDVVPPVRPLPVPPDAPVPPVLHRARNAAVGLGRGTRAFAELVGLPPDARTVLRGPLGTVKTVVWSDPLPLEEVRRAARAAGGTINDLVLAALAGGLQEQLRRSGGPVRDVRAVLPVNLRPFDPDSIELGNRFGLMFLRLPVSADPADRVALVQRRTAALKRSAMAFVALGILRVAGRSPYRCMQLIISIFSAKGSAVVTNVEGPASPLHVGGSRLAGVIAWPPQSGSIGLGVSVISYAGNVVVGVMADDRVVPDAHALLARTRAELTGYGLPAAG